MVRQRRETKYDVLRNLDGSADPHGLDASPVRYVVAERDEIREVPGIGLRYLCSSAVWAERSRRERVLEFRHDRRRGRTAGELVGERQGETEPCLVDKGPREMVSDHAVQPGVGGVLANVRMNQDDGAHAKQQAQKGKEIESELGRGFALVDASRIAEQDTQLPSERIREESRQLVE